jgi:hypothetical protein
MVGRWPNVGQVLMVERWQRLISFGGLAGRSVADVLNGLGEMLGEAVGFGDDVFHSGVEGGLHEFVRRMKGEHDDGGVGRASHNAASGFEAIHDWHLKIENDDIGT